MTLIPLKTTRPGNGSQSLAPFDAFRGEMDRLFDSFFSHPFGLVEGGTGRLAAWNPALDVAETADEVTVRAEIPGVKPEELEVTVTGDTLELAGEKKESSEKKEKGYWHSETRYGSFRRIVRLPADVDADKVEATYENGVVTITLKKATVTQAKRIPVKTT